MRPMKTFTRNRRRKFIESYAYAPDFIAKLQGELGDRATVLRALEGLDAWFVACLYAEDRMIGMPSKIVDVAWHEFILRTREYTNFCQRAFGAYLHHTPDSTMNIAATSLLPATLEIAERHTIPMVLFTADEDSGYRDGYVYSSADLHRMRDTYSHPRRTRKRRVRDLLRLQRLRGRRLRRLLRRRQRGRRLRRWRRRRVRWRRLRRRRLVKGSDPLGQTPAQALGRRRTKGSDPLFL